MRILLVEDEKELSRALAKMLMKEGYDVDTVYDGADGLNFALSGLYDLIVLDILMPKKNGLEVLQEIRSRGLETPVLMLTALGENKDKVVASAEDAIQGSLDIIAENISDNAKYRKYIKKVCYREGCISTKAAKPEESSKAIVSASLIELYALLGFIVSFLMVINIGK